jgi:PPOX class probable F420-dependent enzyme
MDDGSPHVAPIWIDHEGDMILINTAVGRIKEKNVRRDPRISLSIFDQENPYHMVTIRGKVVELTTAGADAHIDKLAKRYFGVDKYPLRAPGEKRIILKIKAEKIYHQEPPPKK